MRTLDNSNPTTTVEMLTVGTRFIHIPSGRHYTVLEHIPCGGAIHCSRGCPTDKVVIRCRRSDGIHTRLCTSLAKANIFVEGKGVV